MLVSASALSLPSSVEGSPPRGKGELDGGAYVQLSPGVVAVVIDEHKFSREARWAWPWSLGAGWMFARGPMFKATIGASLEHRVFVLEQLTPQGIQAVVESRIGAGNNRVWGYGLLGFGGAAVLVNWGEGNVGDYYGVVGQFGGGIQGLVGRRVFVGGELEFDVSYHFSANRNLGWDAF